MAADSLIRINAVPESRAYAGEGTNTEAWARTVAGKGILIVYYSETGQTRALAETLAAALNAPVERLEAPGLPGGRWGFLVRVWQSLRRVPARITEPASDPAGYSLVVVGSPVWAGRIASPTRAWLRRFGKRVQTGAAFVSYAQSGARDALAEMDRLMPGRVCARLSVSDEDRAQGRDRSKIGEFAAALMRAAAGPAATAGR